MSDSKDVTKSFIYRLTNFSYKFLGKIIKRCNSAAGELNYMMYQMRFGERDDDIYIVSFPKSGTTRMQMLLYQLLTDGNMDFNHIDDISPWLKNDAFENRPDKDLPSPRIIKSHEVYDDFEKETKGRIIYVYRDGRDVAVSKFHQDKNYNNPNLTFDKFMKNFFKEGKSNWFRYHKAWVENKKGMKILPIAYEEMKADMNGVIDKIADFCKIEVTDEIRSRAIERSSFSFMKEYEDKFGVKPVEKVYDNFIRKGKSGEWQEYFSEDDMAEYQRQHEKYFIN